MNTTMQPKLTFHRRSFFELCTPSRTLFIDPVFSRERRGRRVTDKVRSCDYVLATSMTPWFDDVFDVLDGCEATFVSDGKLKRIVADELDLGRDRLLDLEPWERASETGLRITALPITASLGMESAIQDGVSIMRDVQNVFPQRSVARLPLVGAAVPMLEDGLRNVTKLLGGVGTNQRSIGRVGDLLGVDVGRLTGGRPGLGYLVEIEGYGSIMHLADGVHEGTRDEDLEDMADVAQPDVLVVQAAGMAVEPVVRAARTLRPKRVLLYRARDPYRRWAQAGTLPMSSFLGAIEEGAPESKPVHLRKGDGITLDRATQTTTPLAGIGLKKTPAVASAPLGSTVSK